MRLVAAVAPSLLVGALLGFFASQAVQSRGSPGAHTARTEGIFGRSDSAVDYQQLARACVDAAQGTARGDTENAAAPQRPSLDQDQAKASLARIEERALSAGVWSRVAGFKAQALLGSLPTEESRALGARLGEQLRSAGVRLQPGAWVPTEETR